MMDVREPNDRNYGNHRKPGRRASPVLPITVSFTVQPYGGADVRTIWVRVDVALGRPLGLLTINQ
jgi:hypothetical protein